LLDDNFVLLLDLLENKLLRILHPLSNFSDLGPACLFGLLPFVSLTVKLFFSELELLEVSLILLLES